jgi:hypothetical protein
LYGYNYKYSSMKIEKILTVNRLLRVVGILYNAGKLLCTEIQPGTNMFRIIIETGEDFMFDLDNFDGELYKELLTKLK